MLKDRKLHIGGQISSDGWEILNLSDDINVDHKMNAKDLSSFEDNTFSELYASHVLEHFDYQEELLSTLKEWHRVLKKDGIIYVSVPDLEVLSKLFIDKELKVDEKFHVMRMIFGGHMDENDYHLVGLNFIFLMSYLRDAGFSSIRKVQSFDIFKDTSTLRYKDILISCNVIAKKK